MANWRICRNLPGDDNLWHYQETFAGTNTEAWDYAQSLTNDDTDGFVYQPKMRWDINRFQNSAYVIVESFVGCLGHATDRCADLHAMDANSGGGLTYSATGDPDTAPN